VSNGRPINIVLVIFDSLRKDCLSVHGQPYWGAVHTPHLDAFAEESLVMTRAYPESLPTLPARRAIYTGRRVYPFHDGDFRLKGDFVGAPGWGPIPEDQPTLAEILRETGYRTGLISDVYHMFKPSKNFWRGFDQWMFLRGQEVDPGRSGPALTQDEVDYWLPKELQTEPAIAFIRQCLVNMRDRRREEDYFAPRVLREAALWLEQNQDADRFFLTVESFDPHEPWLVPPHYRKMYLDKDTPEQVKSGYSDEGLTAELLERTQANYSASVTQCDRWFGYLIEQMRVLGSLDNTVVIVTTDHGHSIGDRGYCGKRGHPSMPEVYDTPLFIRFPSGEHAATTSDMFVTHVDIAAAILEMAKVAPPIPIDGVPFVADALSGSNGSRDHVTIGWGACPTVITDRWWFNCSVLGTHCLLYDLEEPDPFAHSVAERHPEVLEELFVLAKRDAGGTFPDWLVDLARRDADAPGCTILAARTEKS